MENRYIILVLSLVALFCNFFGNHLCYTMWGFAGVLILAAHSTK